MKVNDRPRNECQYNAIYIDIDIYIDIEKKIELEIYL